MTETMTKTLIVTLDQGAGGTREVEITVDDVRTFFEHVSTLRTRGLLYYEAESGILLDPSRIVCILPVYLEESGE
jgi:hypothetical protein